MKSTIKNIFKVGASLMALTTTSLFAQNPVSDPDNKEKWIFNETLSDEFDGNTLDKSKWWILGENGDYRSKWKGRAPGQFVAENVHVREGELVIQSKWDPDFEFIKEKNNGVFYGGTKDKFDKSHPITQACIMSESFFQYGYMEIRCKVADSPVTSAFWTTGYKSEIDMIENFGKLPIGNPENKPEALERKYRTNVINWEAKKDPEFKTYKAEDVMEYRLAEDYHVYGFEWDKDYMKTFIDGKLVRHVTRAELEEKNQWMHQFPQELWINSEVFSWYGLPTKEDLAEPAEFYVDYVRIWQKETTGPHFDALGFEGPFFFQGRSVNWWCPGKEPWRLSDDKASDGTFALRFKMDKKIKNKSSIFSPFGSLDLPKGENELTFKIWIDKKTDIKKLTFVLQNPFKPVNVNLSDVKKGKWVEVTVPFKRKAASDLALKGGDRIQISVSADDIKGEQALFYIDEISFKQNNNIKEAR
ncbi:family 16 glycosylhydrolase [Flammeovirga yaeyamensis]|uniref:Family 16 glycosylhydrolase n=1 Tax=Flammeovirga yaeyamensis TaxID=367791 RepID=A0AAX1NCM2_9BACT|nr:family 16 glycosylhydrolase [Flammeovirga yaeyamensis]MBB3699916.1 beta-glucanase (GH16 family) [Flammeovirga yaeyamensis]NMF37645.1 family 16 glycosylhydrolase [Flammeovirga yaeyamensis]QWG04701.1 family 16 glycosylhydrolase [Flammeovirga yaeyamensis]